MRHTRHVVRQIVGHVIIRVAGRGLLHVSGHVLGQIHKEVRIVHSHGSVGIDAGILLSPSLILASDIPRLIAEGDLPLIGSPHEYGRALDARVNEVQPHASVAGSVRLDTVVAFGLAFIALQMPFSAGEAACANPLSLGLVLGYLFPRPWCVGGTLAARHCLLWILS